MAFRRSGVRFPSAPPVTDCLHRLSSARIRLARTGPESVSAERCTALRFVKPAASSGSWPPPVAFKKRVNSARTRGFRPSLSFAAASLPRGSLARPIFCKPPRVPQHTRTGRRQQGLCHSTSYFRLSLAPKRPFVLLASPTWFGSTTCAVHRPTVFEMHPATSAGSHVRWLIA